MEILEKNAAPALEPVTPEGGRAVVSPRAGGEGPNGGLPESYVDEFRQALAAACGPLLREGAAPWTLTDVVLFVRSHDDHRSRNHELDLAWRFVLAGNIPTVTAVEAGDLGPGRRVEVQAAGVVPPPAGDAPVYGDYTWAEVNFQYSPRAQVGDVEAYFAKWRVEGPAFQTRHCTAELSFGDGPGQTVDLYMPEGVRNPPVHVFIHGGYWQALDKRDHAQLGAALLKDGVAVAMTNYDLMPAVDLPEISRQTREAVALVARMAGEYGYDVGRLTVSGHSAGGHLTGVVISTDWPSVDASLPRDLVKGAVPISGLFDLEPLRHTGMNHVFRFTKESAAQQSPANMTPAWPMPVAISVGGDESAEFHRQTRLYADHLRRHGCAVEEVAMPGCNHFSVVEGLAEPGSPLYRAVRALTSA